MEIFLFVAGALSGVGIAAIGLFTLGQPMVERWLGQSLRRGREQDRALLKDQLDAWPKALAVPPPAVTHFSRLQEKQAEIIAEIYARLSLIHGYLYELAGLHACATDPKPKDNQGALVEEYRKLSGTLNEAIHETSRYLQKQGIYFTGPLAEQLTSVQAIFLKARTAHWHQQKGAPTAAVVSFEQTPKELESALRLLEQHFNHLLLKSSPTLDQPE